MMIEINMKQKTTYISRLMKKKRLTYPDYKREIDVIVIVKMKKTMIVTMMKKMMRRNLYSSLLVLISMETKQT